MRPDNTEEMIQHFKKEWIRDDIRIIKPSNVPFNAAWNKINRDNIQIKNYKQHEKAEEWTLIVHEVFRFGVVKNKHGYYIEQLYYKP